MKKLFGILLVSFLMVFMVSCGDNDDTNNGPTGTDIWNMTITVDLGGEFEVVATADITMSGNTFTAVVNTTTIGGQAEAHEIELEGDSEILDDGTYKLILKDEEFEIPGETIEVSGTVLIDDALGTLSGSGTLVVEIDGVDGLVSGKFDLTGTKQVED